MYGPRPAPVRRLLRTGICPKMAGALEVLLGPCHQSCPKSDTTLPLPFFSASFPTKSDAHVLAELQHHLAAGPDPRVAALKSCSGCKTCGERAQGHCAGRWGCRLEDRVHGPGTEAVICVR